MIAEPIQTAGPIDAWPVAPAGRAVAPRVDPAPAPVPTLWGLTPGELHDRYWAARGVQVVRLGARAEVAVDAELYLLTDHRVWVRFDLLPVLDRLTWESPDIVFLRLHEHRPLGYRERVLTASDGTVQRVERVYKGVDSRLARVAVTDDARLAALWSEGLEGRGAWRAMRRRVRRDYRLTLSLAGEVHDAAAPAERERFVRSLQTHWRRPDTTIDRTRRTSGDVWADADAVIEPGAVVRGSVWIGAGRRLRAGQSVVGPAVVWDDPAHRPRVDPVIWDDVEPVLSTRQRVSPPHHSRVGLVCKRAFDVTFAAAVLALTLPLYPLIMAAIYLEDRRPFFYAQRREGLGGREFGCLKFRSMYRNADEIKARLAMHNQADGPQFFMDDDPRVTRVGRVLRATNLDELPQFFNVLVGHMSVVGPRPSPHRENQFCPQWREARLSVRPGITGLWQVRRSRRLGEDFQEWIRYDLEYVARANPWLDLRLIFQTVQMIIGKALGR